MSKSKKIFPLIAIHDRLFGYKNITVEANEDIAIRAFTNSLKRIILGDDISEISPEDLSLYCLGSVDMDSGEVIPSVPKLLIHGNNVVTKFSTSSFSSEE